MKSILLVAALAVLEVGPIATGRTWYPKPGDVRITTCFPLCLRLSGKIYQTQTCCEQHGSEEMTFAFCVGRNLEGLEFWEPPCDRRPTHEHQL